MHTRSPLAGRSTSGRSKRVLAAAIGLVLAASLALSGTALAHTGDDGLHHHDGWMGMHDGWMGMGTGFGWFWLGLFALILIGAVATAAYALSERPGEGRSGGSTDEMTVLRTRYARGEIDEAEFERRRNFLLETGEG